MKYGSRAIGDSYRHYLKALKQTILLYCGPSPPSFELDLFESDLFEKCVHVRSTKTMVNCKLQIIKEKAYVKHGQMPQYS